MRKFNKSKNNLILDNLENVDLIDTVMIFHVLEHIKKPLDFIEFLKSKLKKTRKDNNRGS